MADPRLATIWLAARSVFWAVVFPGMLGLYIPWRYFGVRDATIDVRNVTHWTALAGIALGVSLLSACIVEFARRGRGTLSAFDPPTQLVVQGLYRYVRNPMYLSVSLMALGQALLIRSTDLAIYWVVFFIVTNAFVLFYEEPTLRRMFGASYERYAAGVPRWLPRLRPWFDSGT